MSTKTSIAAGDNYHFYIDAMFKPEPEEVFISVTNPSTCTVESNHNCIVQATITITVKDMDKIALAWIKERNLILD